MKRMPRKLVVLEITVLAGLGLGCWYAVGNWPARSTPSLIPFPSSYVPRQGVFTLDPSTRVYSVDTNTTPIASYFCGLINRSMGWNLTCAAPATLVHDVPGQSVWLILDPATFPSNSEGYSLNITARRVEIASSALAGIFYGIQTIRQLLPALVESAFNASSSSSPGSLSIPCCMVKDAPRFTWRGFMLDDARYFHGVALVKKMLDVMALFKMNTFHWHLTDDQGWRIQILQYPNLTAIGAWRNESNGDRIPTGGFYTQEQIRDIVKYASDRFIKIIPEIEMPGHSLAALASYPWLGCTGGPYSVETGWGVFKDVYCGGKESTFTFLENVLTEVR